MKILDIVKKKIKNIIKKNINYLTPTLVYESILKIPIEKLKSMKIDTVLIDLDNTLVPWNKRDVPKEIIDYLINLKKNGFKICVVSNALPLRVKKITQELDIPYIAIAAKPSTRPLRKAIKLLNSKIENTVIIGDQIFTDILAGNRLGIKTILVRPLANFELITSKFVRLLEYIILQYIQKKQILSTKEGRNEEGDSMVIY
ncbi:MAG: YqeG family HAD IIIA-type phosphatase [bacterium]